MISNRFLSRLKLYKRVNACLLSTTSEESIAECEDKEVISNEPIPNKTKPTKKKREPSKKQLLDLNIFFHEYPHLLEHKELIPNKLLYYRARVPDYIYLVCPIVAKKVANYILPTLNLAKNHVVAESNPGLGFISRELINSGVPTVRLYETNNDFHPAIKELFKHQSQHMQLFTKDLFRLSIYSYQDRQDGGHRVASLLEGVPHRSWVDDPVMTVIGSITDISFISYMIRCIVTQTDICTYGRIELFALTYGKLWHDMSLGMENVPKKFRTWRMLFKIFFQVKLLDTFSRELFLPWQQEKELERAHGKYDPDNIYLVQISMSKNVCLKATEFIPFYCFMRTFLNRGSKYVIPTCEKLVPGCGIHLMNPTLKHEDYFEDMNIFTQFKDLNSNQLVAIFKELTSRPEYSNSPLMDMIDTEIMNIETIQTELFEERKSREKKIVKTS